MKVPLQDWLPSASMGVFFTTFGMLKIWGLRRGIIGGCGKSAMTRACGSCPSWSLPVNIALTLLFLAIGIFNLALLALLLLKVKK
jgi:hypothetical protein